MARCDGPGGWASGFVGRLEVVEGATGRRQWPDAVKARIVAESFARGAKVSAVAGRHGVSPQQLTGWRRATRDGLLPMPAAMEADEGLGFVPLAIEERVAASEGGHDQPIEIAVAGVVVRLPAATPATRIAEIVGALGGRR